MTSRTKGTLLLLLSAGSFATEPVLIRAAYRVEIVPLNLLALRFAVAALILWTWWLVRESRPAGEGLRAALRRERPLWLRLLPLGALQAVIVSALTYSLVTLSAALGITLFYTFPAFVAIISTTVLGERLSRQAWAALGLAVIGVVIVLWGPTGAVATIGIVLAFIAALMNAVFFISSDRLLRGVREGLRADIREGLTAPGSVGADVPPTVTGRYVMGTTALLLLSVASLAGDLQPVLPAGTWVLVALLGSLSTVVPLVTFFEGVKYLGAARAAVVSSAEPVVAAFLGVIFLGEPVGVLQAVGTAVIIAGIFVLQREESVAETDV